MKGIILAGGTGSRLFPNTCGVSKQLLPVYDKPMIYYPLSVLMLAGIRDVLLIVAPEDEMAFGRLFGDGSHLGMVIRYMVQPRPEGLAQALLLGEGFVGDDSVCLILGDNIFYGQGFTQTLRRASWHTQGATVFAKQVKDPERFGVVSFDASFRAVALNEKPEYPTSDWAVTGLYFYDNQVFKFARQLKPSKRGELEITDLNRMYLHTGQLNVEILGRGFAWLDTGTPDSLHEASAFVKTVQNVQHLYIACLEEIAWRQGWLSDNDLLQLAECAGNNAYGRYIRGLLGAV